MTEQALLVFDMKRERCIAVRAAQHISTIAAEVAAGQLSAQAVTAELLGRYLDAECDLLVNAALFAALGWYSQRPVTAAVGFALGPFIGLQLRNLRQRLMPCHTCHTARGPGSR